MGCPVSCDATRGKRALALPTNDTALVTLRWRHAYRRRRHKDEIDDFHDHLKEQNADIHFTKKIEKTENVFF